MKNFLKYLSVSVLSLLVMGTGFAIWKSGQPSEVVYKSIKATLNGTTTGTTYFEVTGGMVMDGSGNSFITGGYLSGYITGEQLASYVPYSGATQDVYIGNHNIVLGIGQYSLYGENTFGDYAGIQFPDDSQAYIFGSVADTIFDVSRLTSDKIVYLPDMTGTVMLDTMMTGYITGTQASLNYRALSGNDVYYTTGNIYGNGIIAKGNSNTAAGAKASALGSSCQARGATSVAIGNSAIASGSSSVAIGAAANAYGGASVAVGKGTAAYNSSSNGANAFGSYVIASGDFTTVIGKYNTVIDNYPFIVGIGTSSVRKNGLVIDNTGYVGIGTDYPTSKLTVSGNINITTGYNIYDGAGNQYITGISFPGLTNGYIPTWSGNTFMNSNLQYGDTNLSIGTRNFGITVIQGISMGLNTQVLGKYGIAIGTNSLAYGQQSMALLGGYANSTGSIAMINGGTYGEHSLAIGNNSVANANNSVAMQGGVVTGSADYGFALGVGIKTNSPYGFNIGHYNLGLTNSIFEIGYGLSGSSLNNAVTVLNNGYMGIGTSNPQYALDVSGSIQSNTAFQLTNGTDIFRQVFSGNNVVAQFKSGSNWITVTEYVRPR